MQLQITFNLETIKLFFALTQKFIEKCFFLVVGF